MSIYFLKHGGLIKIGYSGSLATRVRALIASIPTGDVAFLGHFPGDRETETHLHKIFHHLRFSGEWFIENEAITSLISIIADPMLPDVSDFNVGGTSRRADSGNFRAYSVRFRTACAFMWPDLNHNERKQAATALLGWTPRRVKSLYQADQGCALRVLELEQLETKIFTALMADAEAMSPTPLDPAAGQPTGTTQPKLKGE